MRHAGETDCLRGWPAPRARGRRVRGRYCPERARQARGETGMVRMSGKRALLEQLIADGVRYIFGNPGTTEQGFMDLLQEYPQLEFILGLHEGVVVSMADAYARLTRRP